MAIAFPPVRAWVTNDLASTSAIFAQKPSGFNWVIYDESTGHNPYMHVLVTGDVRIANALPAGDAGCLPCSQGEQMVRTAGLEPARATPDEFSYHFGFRRRQEGVRGLDYPFTLAIALGAARLVSTPSTLADGLARDWQATGLSFPRI